MHHIHTGYFACLYACCHCSFVGIVGEHDESDNSYHLWTHKKFEIGYNGNRIVDVNLTSEVKTKLVPNQKIFLTYEVS